MTHADQTFLRSELLENLLAIAKKITRAVKVTCESNQLAVDRKLAREFLKPKLELSCSLLGHQVAKFGTEITAKHSAGVIP
jgi:hypothetical protein